MIASELIEQLKTLPQDKEIMCQVVGGHSGAWNMQFRFVDIEHSSMVQLKVEHSDLKDLPMDSGIFKP